MDLEKRPQKIRQVPYGVNPQNAVEDQMQFMENRATRRHLLPMKRPRAPDGPIPIWFFGWGGFKWQKPHGSVPTKV